MPRLPSGKTKVERSFYLLVLSPRIFWHFWMSLAVFAADEDLAVGTDQPEMEITKDAFKNDSSI